MAGKLTRVLVCGGRDRTDYWTIDDVLSEFDQTRPITTLIQGGALGADRFAKAWAERHFIPVLTFHADWREFGKSAGPIRNLQMIIEGKPDIIIAFPGGRGTANMVVQGREWGIEVMEIVK